MWSDWFAILFETFWIRFASLNLFEFSKNGLKQSAMHMMHDAMSCKKKKQPRILFGENPPGVTDDTTNKGLRPRNPPTNLGGKRSLITVLHASS